METTCPHCAQSLDLDADTLAALGNATEFECPTCRGPVPVPAVPPEAVAAPGIKGIQIPCPSCSAAIEIDLETLRALQNSSHFDCPTCGLPVPVPGSRAALQPQPPGTGKTGAISLLISRVRGMNRNLVILGSASLLLLGGLGIFLATHKAPVTRNTKREVKTDVTNNKFFQDLIASGATTAKDLEAVSDIRPNGIGFVGMSIDKCTLAQAQELAKRTASKILTLDEPAAASRQPLLEWLATTYPDLLGSTAWIMDGGEAKVVDPPDVNRVTTMDRPRRAFLDWRPRPAKRETTKPAFKANVDGEWVGGITVQKDGKLLIRGSFTAVDGVPCPGIARLNADGTLDRSFELDPAILPEKVGWNGGIMDAVARDDGSLIVGRSRSTTGESVVRLNTEGKVVPGFAPKVERNAAHEAGQDNLGSKGVFIRHLMPQPDGKLIVVGDFTSVGGAPHNLIARLNYDGSLDGSFKARVEGRTSPRIPERIDTLALQGDGKIVICGQFTTVDGTPRNRFARLNTDGSLDRSFNADGNEYMQTLRPGRDANPPPDASFPGKPFPHVMGNGPSERGLSVQSDGKIVFVGGFSPKPLPLPNAPFPKGFSGSYRYGVARLNADGRVDAGFNADLPEQLFDVVSLPGGRTIITGFFQKIDGLERKFIALFKADGSLDKDFDFMADSTVNMVKPLPDGRLLLSGRFTTIRGVPSKHMALIKFDAK